MKIVGLLVSVFFMITLAAEYRIDLNWDEFSGECNGFLSGTIDEDFDGVSGVASQTKLDGKLVSLGEGKTATAKQTFLIHSEEGYFSFWLKDKLADQNMRADMDLISNAKPVVKIYKNDVLQEQIDIPAGKGLTCKVFTLDVSDEKIDKEIRFFPKSRIIVGRAVNAIDGKPLSDVTVTITDNINQTTSFQTDESGIFIFEVELGAYQVSFSKTGFISSEIETRMGIDETPREIYCAMSPEIKEFRIVLTWGSRPQDLDAHLKGPHPEGGNFHIWYRNRILIAGRDFLDRDDMNGYGPETITIYKPAKGDYSYSVHDYSNRNRKRSSKLSFSNATVQIYNNNKLLQTFQVPKNVKGNVWRVFKINERHEIIPLDEIDFISNEANI